MDKVMAVKNFPRYWAKLFGIFENERFPSRQKNDQEQQQRPKTGNLRSKRPNLIKTLLTWSAQTWVPRQYNMNNTK